MDLIPLCGNCHTDVHDEKDTALWTPQVAIRHLAKLSKTKTKKRMENSNLSSCKWIPKGKKDLIEMYKMLGQYACCMQHKRLIGGVVPIYYKMTPGEAMAYAKKLAGK